MTCLKLTDIQLPQNQQQLFYNESHEIKAIKWSLSQMYYSIKLGVRQIVNFLGEIPIVEWF